eukprot:1777497-Rhodomonas_salina.5
MVNYAVNMSALSARAGHEREKLLFDNNEGNARIIQWRYPSQSAQMTIELGNTVSSAEVAASLL